MSYRKIMANMPSTWSRIQVLNENSRNERLGKSVDAEVMSSQLGYLSWTSLTFIGVMLLSTLKAVGAETLADALLAVSSILMAGSVIYNQGLRKSLGATGFFFILLTSIYLTWTIISPSVIGVKNTIGVLISAAVFFYFVSKANDAVRSSNVPTFLIGGGVSSNRRGTYFTGRSKKTRLVA
ncbi:hypothetical protein CLG85_018925 [Yangia mangrovi]|uniref:Uncharacterized protein n=1 Tax=Alloyangia mangrovi TaxID=1779329 RepID=A0ABT2KR22_9RHOB|nr:hypothetical protein [Alloyangia mangrovi]MCT4372276.1 hypothetical protein [Alloyangia mangrovi]